MGMIGGGSLVAHAPVKDIIPGTVKGLLDSCVGTILMFLGVIKVNWYFRLRRL